MRSEGELAIEAFLTPQTSHEGSWCQASIALPPKGAPVGSLVSRPAQSFLSQLISTAPGCRPCGVVGDALASSKRSGKSTGFLLAIHTAGGQRTGFSIEIAARHGDVSCRLRCDPWLEPMYRLRL